MAVPKKKTSKRRTANRASANVKVAPIMMTKCPQCGEPIRSHVACAFCGFYAGKKVLNVKSKLDKKISKKSEE
jgi:large subunit ribosomal protein L32